MKILDMTAGGRNIWLDKFCPDAVFVDHRVAMNPDVVADSTCLPFDNESFDLIVFDPPHGNFGVGSNQSRLYGSYTLSEIREFMRGAAAEAHRVGRAEALMAFKWCNHDMRHDWALAILDPWWRALFGHVVSIRSRHASTSQWFMLSKKRRQGRLFWEN